MAGPLRVEVRVAEGRHLFRAVSRGSGVPEAGDDGSERKKYSASAGAATSGRAPPLLNATLCVSITLGDKHVLTEQCADLQRPVWDKVASFTYDPCPPPADAAAAPHEVEPSAAAVEMTDMFRAMGLPSRAAEPHDQQLPLEPHSGKPSPPAAAAGLQQLSASATAGAAPTADAHARRRALHLRVFSDSLVSKDLLGEVTVDVAALVATGGALLVTDRIGYTDSGGAGSRGEEDDGDSSGAFMVPLALAASPTPPRSHHSERVSANGAAAAAVASAVDFEPLAVDTWVALRQGDGELRVQVLVRPDPSAATAALAAALLRDQSASADALADSTGFTRAAANASPPVQQRLVPAYAGGGGSSSSISSMTAGAADVTRLSAAAEAAAAAVAPAAAALPVSTSTLEFHDYESDPEHPVETEPMRLQGSTDSNGARGSRRRRARRSELDGEVARLQEYKRHSTAGGGRSSMASANGGGAHAAASRKSSSKGMWRRRRPRPWGALDRAAAAHGDAIVSAPFWLGPLADKLRAVEERYSYSYALAYSQTVVTPGSEAAAAAAAAGMTPTDAVAAAAAAPPDTAAAAAAEPAAASWAAAADGAYGAALQRGMLYHCVRVARQREAWARCLVASLELRDAIRAPPPFRALLAPQRGAGGRAGVRVHGAADTPLFDLVLGGIPPSLFGEDCGLGEAEAEGGGGCGTGGATADWRLRGTQGIR
ncbi:hypothetical protein JKP88DRAFT_281267 [Tribonema minus]|uniref:C2 domain-containing protein n=1 Tax=Tribonema minus TaxID=303371 RepID=A0A836CAD2_9STRA|nr:hypothetical protein JKP88DRAFT_281267 [Tribonema minus]